MFGEINGAFSSSIIINIYHYPISVVLTSINNLFANNNKINITELL